MILRGFAIYCTHAEESLDETYQYIKDLLSALPYVHLFRNVPSVWSLFSVSVTTPHIIYTSHIYQLRRSILQYTHPTDLHQEPARAILFEYLILIQHPPGAIIARMVLWQDTVPLLITNNCADTIWPGIYTTAGTGPGTGGFELAAGANRSLEVGSDWYGRIWGRTNCTSPSEGVLTCTTGSCGQMDCTQAAVSRNLIPDVYVTAD